MFAPLRARSSAAVAALLLTIVCGGCSGRRERPAAAPRVKPPVALAPRQALEARGREVRIRWRNPAGLPIVDVEAKGLKGEEAGQRAVLTNATARLYREGKPAAVVTAPKIEADGEKRILVASQGVLVKSSDGESSARADSVRWEADRQRISGKGNVVVRWRGLELIGDEFTADTSLGRVKITSKSNGRGRLR